jgi:predicted O-linked N-acetylglucosamine transferase (SPINDLY family)
MDRHTALLDSLKQADSLRRSSHWTQAIEIYLAAEGMHPKEAGIKHNAAVCYLALNNAEAALRYADLAIDLNADLWQSRLLKAKSLRRLGKSDLAIPLLIKLLKQFPESSEIRLELSSLAMEELGDAALAEKLVRPLHDHPQHGKNARLTELMANLYDSEKSADELSSGLCAFANVHLQKPRAMSATMSETRQRVSARRRVGLLSPQFCCSPVYFFCVGALRHLAQDVDLVFLNRGRREDWATKEFQALAAEWLDVADLDAERLAAFIARQSLDVLIDMGGWMDPVGLSALSGKPAKRLYKWVGGQSATTGISAFDGFLTDAHQSLPEDQAFYAEPLIFLQNGYVTYTPPPYMPGPTCSDAGDVFGVISNPVKISRDFLVFLKTGIEAYLNGCNERISLRFIDRRYRHAQLRSRIAMALQMDSLPNRERLKLDFIVPHSHRNYLEEVGKLTAVLDTFPYTGGLTTVEALALGVPCITKAGRLFCERHSYAHCRYAGLEPPLVEIGHESEKNLAEMLHFYHLERQKETHRSTLISKSSPRLDHQALANALFELF